MFKLTTKRMILLVLTSVLLVSTCMVLFFASGSRVSKAECVIDGTLESEYFIGQEVVVPNGTFEIDNENITATHEVVLPNGSTISSNKFIVNQTGLYTIRYSTKVSNKTYFNEKQFKKSQLCLTAHGNESEYQAMLNTVFEKMYNEIMTYNLDIVTWTLMDNYDACECKYCSEVNTYYGARSGKLVEFCNTLSDMFKERFEQENINKEIIIMFFAYYYYTSPPKLGTIECRDNVYPIIAPYNEMDRAASIHSEKNANVKNTIDTWSKMCKRFGFWVYSVNFNSYLAPFDPFSSLQENYAYFASKDPVYFFDEGFTTQFVETPPSFNALKDFLSSKIAWNVDADVQSLTADFFTNYFKDASLIMYDYYTKYRLKLQILFENKGYTHNLNMDVYNTDFFEFGTLLSWQNCINEAYKTIEKYKATDFDLYQKLDKRIRAEALTVDFMILKLYKSYYTSVEYSRLVDKFYADCSTVGLLSGQMWRPMEQTLPR